MAIIFVGKVYVERKATERRQPKNNSCLLTCVSKSCHFAKLVLECTIMEAIFVPWPVAANLHYFRLFGGQKRLNGGFGEGLLKDKFAFFKPYKVLHLRGENCLQNAHFYKQKGPV